MTFNQNLVVLFEKRVREREIKREKILKLTYAGSRKSLSFHRHIQLFFLAPLLIAWRLHHVFSKEVFDVPVKQIIKSKRTITDIKRMSTEVVKKGSLIFNSFLKAAKVLTGTIIIYPDNEVTKIY